MSNGNIITVRQRQTTVKSKRYKYWLVDCGLVDGKRLTKQFRHQSKAEAYAAKVRIQKRRLGEMAFRLSDQEREDATKALAVLRERATLEKAAQFYINHTDPKGGKRTIAEVVAEYRKRAVADGLRPRTIRDLDVRLGRFQSAFSGRMICALTRLDLEKWVQDMRHADGSPLSPISKRNYLVVVSGLFNYAMEQEYVHENPLTRKSHFRRRLMRQDQSMPGILTVAQVEKLLRMADEFDKEIVPAIAIGFFAGLRTNELCQLDWSHVNLEAKLITVPPSIAKRRSVRHVDVSDNLSAWLKPHYRSNGLIAPKGTAWRYNLDKIRRLAEIKDWPTNAMRHSFASYHLALHQNQNITALQLGHRDTDLLYNHYRNLVPRSDAEKYWAIMPSLRV